MYFETLISFNASQNSPWFLGNSKDVLTPVRTAWEFFFIECFFVTHFFK